VSERVRKVLFCRKCDGPRIHNPSLTSAVLHVCIICHTLTNQEDPIHTHTHSVTPPYKVDGFKNDDHVLRQKPEEKREGERE